MNAPFPPAMLRDDWQCEVAKPVEAATVRLAAVRMSSRPLGWRPLNIERREETPGAHSLPGGTTEHLIFVNLAEGQCLREGLEAVVDSAFAPGHVSVHPAFLPVRWQWTTRLSFIALALEPDFVDRTARQVFDLAPGEAQLKVVEGQRDPFITQLAGLLTREVMSPDAGSRPLAESLATQLTVHLIRNYTRRLPPSRPDTNPVVPRAVSAAVAFIDENYERDISLGDIAASVHLSPFHLARTFKKTVAVTPHQYLVQVRVNSARSLIHSGAGAGSLAEIAAAVGFADQSHLTRQFKRVFGKTPRQLRQ
jgi:AraC family transcriptional regulator